MRSNGLTSSGKLSDKNILRGQLVFAGLFVLAVAILFFFFNLLTHGNFLEWTNIKIILANMVYPTLWLGMCFLLACGYSDMSWGGIVVLASFGTRVLAIFTAWPPRWRRASF
jgi:ribose transport system permease protein